MKVPKEAWCARNPFVKHLKVFGPVCYKHVPGQRRTKLQDKSENMIFIGYHLTCAHKLYTHVDKNVHVSRDVVFDESETWKWQTKDTMEDEVKHICVDYDENGESDDEINGEDYGVSEATQTKSHAHGRPQRRRQVHRRLKDCEILPDSEV